MRWRGALVQTFGAFMPVWLWNWANEYFTGHTPDVLEYTPVSADRLAALDLPALARERDLDFYYRPWKEGFAMRLWVMRRLDPATSIRE